MSRLTALLLLKCSAVDVKHVKQGTKAAVVVEKRHGPANRKIWMAGEEKVAPEVAQETMNGCFMTRKTAHYKGMPATMLMTTTQVTDPPGGG